ncbi:MAG TPA: DUF5916 domain-containing protein [Vicinamibacterales bacterium]|nr:DUF5916 domain-containing protein [Vicinamibacterales bacterium]
MRAYRLACCAVAVLLVAWSVEAQSRQPHGAVPIVTAVRAAGPVSVDGRLDEAVWGTAAPASGFRQRDPDEGKLPTERTELRVAFDDDAIYVGARLFDREPLKVVRRLSRRDESADADTFTVYLDPRLDHLTGARFTVSAGGALADAIIYNDSWTDSSWDAVWEAAVSVDDNGWTAEMRIPLSQLRFTTANTEAWGINAERFIQRRNESDWLELVPKKESGLASRMAHLVGVRGIDPPRHLEVMPYASGRAEFIEPSGPGDPFNDGSRIFGGAGVDLKYGVTSSFTLAATVNPDFGQVEVDPAVVNLTAFETFFQERRPFFIEGAQIFGNYGSGGANSFWGFNNFEPDIFYSRRIGRAPQGSAAGEHVDRPPATTILGAAKLTGKTSSGWNIGVLEAVTSREHARAREGSLFSRPEVEPLTNYFVGRVQREVGRAGVGMLATSVERAVDGSTLADTLVRRANVVGADGYVFFDRDREWVVTGALSASRVAGSAAAIERLQRAPQRYFQRPDRLRVDAKATSLSGWAGRLFLNRNRGVWIVNAGLWGVSPGFESGDLGFTYRTGINGAHVVLQRRDPTPNRWSRSRTVWAGKWWTWDADRRLQGNGYNANGSITFNNYWDVSGGWSMRHRTRDNWLTRGGPVMTGPAGGSVSVSGQSDSRRPISFEAYAARSWNEYGGYGDDLGLELRLKPSSSISVSTGPELYRSHALAQYVTEIRDPLATQTYGSRYVFSTLDQTELTMTTRVTWVLSPDMSLQVYAQPLLSAADYSGLKELARPGSFEFLVYGDGASTIAHDPNARRFAIDPDGGGPAPRFDVADPDFNFRSLRLNAVFRWEWRLGSTLYLVWTEQRQDSAARGDFATFRDARALFRAPGDDVFLVKVSYWFSR